MLLSSRPYGATERDMDGLAFGGALELAPGLGRLAHYERGWLRGDVWPVSRSPPISSRR